MHRTKLERVTEFRIDHDPNDDPRMFLTPDAHEALIKLGELVRQERGELYIWDMFRPWNVQAKAHELWNQGKKPAYIAPPGGSFHQAGRAVDFGVDKLRFHDVEEKDWLRKFWDLSFPLGWHPIIKEPSLGISECWHFDFPGKDWEDLYNCKPYGEVAKACILDVGCWSPDGINTEFEKRMFCQAQLARLGFYSGLIDGVFGQMTREAMSAAKIALDTTLDNLCEILIQYGIAPEIVLKDVIAEIDLNRLIATMKRLNCLSGEQMLELIIRQTLLDYCKQFFEDGGLK